MFAIVPAQGKPSLSRAQARLLAGKAKWLHAVAEAGLDVVPTIAITRAAWDALQSERKAGSDALRKVWVTTLFKLVSPGSRPPELVVRTSAPHYITGLSPARTDIPAPANALEAVDPRGALGKAITAAFASYGPEPAGWAAEAEREMRDNQVVIVQATATGKLERFVTRNTASGRLGPVAMPGESLPDLPPNTTDLIRVVDAVSGQHMACLIAIEAGRAVFLSARPVQVSAGAQLEASVERVDAKVWTPGEAVQRFNPAQLPQLLHPRLTDQDRAAPIASGLGVSPGAASGEVVFTADDAARCKARGRHCILVVMETGPGDIEGMKAATGFVTARGGMTSHAAVVARITGKPCVAGLRNLQIDIENGVCKLGDRIVSAGERITIDGSEGAIYAGALPLSRPHIGGALSRLLDWADDSRTISVRTNAETIEAARTALSFGAEGIGLARSEHMFFSGDRMRALRRLILSENEEDRATALEGLVDYQAADYAALFQTMQNKPVTVRLFDPPLHEFLPRSEDDIEDTAQALGLSLKALKARLQRLDEVNPMLGHRGVRLVITYPEILAMQIRALVAGVEAAMDNQDLPVNLEIMVPFVTSAREVAWVKQRIMDIAANAPVFRRGANLAIGAMIELPRACLRAGDIARDVDFISFGTNDLTQTTYGISRDDAPAFLATYHRRALYDVDPFVTIDQRGVGELIRIAIERGRAVNPHLKVGICGEHAGETNSLRFFAGLEVDYVSCSPYRVPVARMVLAQADASN
ncbi:PEP-utilizing enzyme [Pelagibacterium sp. 26DY04]|uniref:putative PEP-binding protein n=1 Tax=Pelagibacterium sp. 26DY04 TaxID=2967130 RepID=UPI002815C1AD|nr:putative PEP-binding protein [Pelagibacterium sp. 26DY04]WMT87891.1 PEP-utilizing enzyme [Pelagibacterium sp. 26DY04]